METQKPLNKLNSTQTDENTSLIVSQVSVERKLDYQKMFAAHKNLGYDPFPKSVSTFGAL